MDSPGWPRRAAALQAELLLFVFLFSLSHSLYFPLNFSVLPCHTGSGKPAVAGLSHTSLACPLQGTDARGSVYVSEVLEAEHLSL